MIFNVAGMLDYLDKRCPSKGQDPRIFGWNLGRQLVAQYLAEILLKCAYAKYHNDAFPHTHSLAYLFQHLPTSKRRAVEEKYKILLNSGVEWTWDVFETVKSFLAFLGDKPITETRYYWDKRSSSNTLAIQGFQGLMAPDDHRVLSYALYIVLHGYPSPPLVKRYDTRFVSLRDALRNEPGTTVKTHEPVSTINNRETSPSTDPRLIYNVEGVLDYFQAKFPHESTDPRGIGWNLGRQVIAQYLIEILLKCAYAKYNDGVFPHVHNLAYLFNELPAPMRRAVEYKYKELLNSEVKSTWDVFETVESFFKFLGDKPITETRYHWDTCSASNTLGVDFFQALVTPDSYRPLVYALYIVLHDYPSRPIVKRHDTIFKSLKDSLKDEPGSEQRPRSQHAADTARTSD